MKRKVLMPEKRSKRQEEIRKTVRKVVERMRNAVDAATMGPGRAETEGGGYGKPDH